MGDAPVDETPPEPGLTALQAPMEGCFWSRPGPGGAPFVQEGMMMKGSNGRTNRVMKTFSPVRATFLACWWAGPLAMEMGCEPANRSDGSVLLDFMVL